MTPFFESPVREVVTILLVTLALLSWTRGTRRFARGVRTEGTRPLDVVRGFRGWIVAVGLLFLAGGVWFGETWPLLFGAVFLFEELIETGVMIFALRRERRAAADSGG